MEYTQVTFVPYCLNGSKHNPMKPLPGKIEGIVSEEPVNVLEALLIDYNIASYKQTDLRDIYENSFRAALQIKPFEPVLGVGGESIEKLKELQDVKKTERKTPLSEYELKRLYTEIKKHHDEIDRIQPLPYFN